MVKIRLRRVGATKQPGYRVVICDSHTARNGPFLEIIGHYNPLTNPEEIVIDKERALSWIKQGAQPSGTIGKLLSKSGITDQFKPAFKPKQEKPDKDKPDLDKPDKEKPVQ